MEHAAYSQRSETTTKFNKMLKLFVADSSLNTLAAKWNVCGIKDYLIRWDFKI